MKIRYHRNWENVCKLKDSQLKYFITWLTWGIDDDEIIGKLNMAFPELFSDQEMPMRIPLSCLRQEAIGAYLGFQEDCNDEPNETIQHLRFAEWFQWDLHRHRFPEVYFFADEGYNDREGVPAEVLKQLDGIEFHAGKPVHVIYHEQDCLVGYVLDMSGGGAELKSGWKFEVGSGKTYFNIDLVPAKYIDLNA